MVYVKETGEDLTTPTPPLPNDVVCKATDSAQALHPNGAIDVADSDDICAIKTMKATELAQATEEELDSLSRDMELSTTTNSFEEEIVDDFTLVTMTTKNLAIADLPPVKYLVEDIIGSNLSILAGPAKCGKSLLALDLATAVANGTEFLGKKVSHGTVLNLALEDTFSRIKERILKMGLTPSENLHVATLSPKLNYGFEKLVRTFKTKHPDLVLVVVDTLQLIRRPDAQTSYKNDVAELSIIKKLAIELDISILCLHHTVKSPDAKGIAKVSGTMGVIGTVDTVVVLDGDRCASNKRTFSFVGKDVGAGDMALTFDSEKLTFDLCDETKVANVRSRNLLPPELTKLCEAIAVNGSLFDTNEVVLSWLHSNNINIETILELKTLGKKYKVELWKKGVEVVPLPDKLRTGTQRYTYIMYNAKNH